MTHTNADTEVITHSQMVSALAKPGKDILATLTPLSTHLTHMALGVAGEAIELLHAIVNGDHRNIVEECGDIKFYIEGLRFPFRSLESPQMLGTDIELKPTQAITELELGYVITYLGGDVLDVVKKHSMYNHGIDFEKLSLVLWQLDCALAGLFLLRYVSEREILNGNMKKLSKRYADFKYTDEQAKTRNDKTGGDK